MPTTTTPFRDALTTEVSDAVLDSDAFRMNHDVLRTYASKCVEERCRSLEYLMVDFAANETKITDDHLLRMDGDLLVPVGTIGVATTYFLEWAEREGLLVITEKGRNLSSCHVDSENLEIGSLPFDVATQQLRFRVDREAAE